MSSGLFTSAEIRARLDAGFPADPDSDHWDWDNSLDNMINFGDREVDEDAIRAFLAFLDVSARSGDKFAPGDFADEFKERYRGHWSSAARFAREYAAPEWADMGDNPTGRREALKEFGDLIDWDARTETAEFTGEWSLVTLPGQDGVYAFREN